ncbi:MAG: glucosaminidase domain-containing protein, partial [Oenococcus sp.]|uniref:glycoside hydrolase family 73 protein n=1 Tax=Oenococcus sp. TaxID=1979414 RepID=UPI0039EB52B7
SVAYANGQHNDHVLEQDLQVSQLLAGSAWTSAAQQQWLYGIVNDAVTAANTNDLYASIMLAQAILESGWGTSRLALNPNNNLFGIKANGSRFANGSVNLPTTEYDENDRPYLTYADFNTYSNILNSFNDYVDKMVHGLPGESSNRYSNVARSIAGSYKDAATNIQQDGYATDPSYADLLVSVIEDYNLNVLDAN